MHMSLHSQAEDELDLDEDDEEGDGCDELDEGEPGEEDELELEGIEVDDDELARELLEDGWLEEDDASLEEDDG
jgi:hypothetical protein